MEPKIRRLIASRRAATHWGGVVLQDAIQDRADNCTEFWLVTPTRLTTAVSRQGEIGSKM